MNIKKVLSENPSCYRKSVILNLVGLIILAAFISLEGEVRASQNIFYVAPTGSNDNPGTFSQPWGTIQHAASSSQVQPGDKVYIRGGVYDEYIQQSISGLPGKPITYSSYPGETPVITGSGSWRWHILEHSHIRIEGMTFRDFQKGAIQIRTKDDSITGIEILNCTFENQSQLNNDGAKTIHVTTTDTDHLVTNVTLRGNHLLNVDTGDHPAIQVEGDAHYVQVIDNTIMNTSSIAIGIVGRPDIEQPTNVLVKGNEITGHGGPDKHSAGIYLDGAGGNIIIEENIVYGGLQGIKVSIEPIASELTTQHVIVRRNLLFNNSQLNLKLGVDDSTASCKIEESVAVHNTILNSLDGVVNNRFGCGKHLRWKNNIFVDLSKGTGFQYRWNISDEVYTPTWLMDYNLFYNPYSGGFYHWGGVTHESLADFKTSSGQDAHSFVADPKLADINIWDLQLEPDSAARDAGGSLTFTTNTGSGTVVPVEEAWYFTDGLGLQDGDRIRIGDNNPVTVVGVNYENHTITVNQFISWQSQDGVSYDYKNDGPDIGAFEFIPVFDLNGSPGDSAVYLNWDINEELPSTAVLQIQYTGPQGTPPSPITNIPLDVREYILIELENYTIYEITLSAIDNGVPILTDTIKVMPTDIYSFLPSISKSP